MARKPKGKYVEGKEPWALAGCKESTFNMRMTAEAKRGETDGPSHQAKRQALEIAAAVNGEAVEAGEVEEVPVEVPAPVEPPVAPPAPKPVQAPAEPERYSPAASLSVPSEPPPPAVAGATVNVTFRCPPLVHDRMREMAHQRRVKLQGIVAAAVEAYLTANKF